MNLNLNFMRYICLPQNKYRIVLTALIYSFEDFHTHNSVLVPIPPCSKCMLVNIKHITDAITAWSGCCLQLIAIDKLVLDNHIRFLQTTEFINTQTTKLGNNFNIIIIININNILKFNIFLHFKY